MQVGDGDRVKKKERKYGGRRRKGEAKRERSGGIESNWTNSGVACSQAVRPRIFVPHTYVRICIYIYIYGTFGDSASVGCNENEGRGYKAPGRDEARGACEY